jgi:hypothetical protein
MSFVPQMALFVVSYPRKDYYREVAPYPLLVISQETHQVQAIEPAVLRQLNIAA